MGPTTACDPHARPVGLDAVESGGIRRRAAGYPARAGAGAIGRHRSLGQRYRPALRLGVTRLALHVPADDLSWTGFTRRLIAVDRAIGPAAQTAVWSVLLDNVRQTFAGTLLRPTLETLEEDYLVGMVRAFDETPNAEALLQRIDLVPLLSGEERPLSEGSRRDLLRQRFSYYVDDLVVMTWDRAFIYEPRDDSDVMDVLDVANAQLLEMR